VTAITRRAITLFLLVCATTHCVLSIFFVNLSYLDLNQYAAGTAPLPFQRRLLLIPFVHWAESSHLLQLGAARYTRYLNQYEPLTSAKFGCLLLGIVMVNALGLLTLRYARKLNLRHDWLIWTLLLVILYASYAARFEQALWYPYDLPHLALFGAATLCLLADEPALFLAFFVVDAFARETSIYLIVVALLTYYRSRSWQIISAISVGLWISTRILAQHLYPSNTLALNGVRWFHMAAPWHWPQIFSIVGFLWIPVWMCSRRYLTKSQQTILYAATICMAATFFFATWNETRVWLEWSTLFAALAAIELQSAFSQPPRQGAPFMTASSS
jgi:hypothetical protein